MISAIFGGKQIRFTAKKFSFGSYRTRDFLIDEGFFNFGSPFAAENRPLSLLTVTTGFVPKYALRYQRDNWFCFFKDTQKGASHNQDFSPLKRSFYPKRKSMGLPNYMRKIPFYVEIPPKKYAFVHRSHIILTRFCGKRQKRISMILTTNFQLNLCAK